MTNNHNRKIPRLAACRPKERSALSACVRVRTLKTGRRRAEQSRRFGAVEVIRNVDGEMAEATVRYRDIANSLLNLGVTLIKARIMRRLASSTDFLAFHFLFEDLFGTRPGGVRYTIRSKLMETSLAAAIKTKPSRVMRTAYRKYDDQR